MKYFIMIAHESSILKSSLKKGEKKELLPANASELFPTVGGAVWLQIALVEKRCYAEDKNTTQGCRSNNYCNTGLN